MARVIIIGAGIAGLAASQLLLQRQTELKAGLELTVLDSSDHAGGWLQTKAHGDYRLEQGPSFLFGHDAPTASLLQRLGLKTRTLDYPLSAQTAYAVHQKTLRPVPFSVKGFLTSPLISTRERLRLLAEPLRPARNYDGAPEESLEAFLGRRLGEEAGARAADVIASLLCNGDPKRLSAECCAAPLVRLEKKAGSLLQGALQSRGENPAPRPSSAAGTLTTFDGGMKTLVNALAEPLHDRLKLKTRVAHISRSQPHQQPFEVHLSHGGTLQADAVLVTCPAWTAGPMLTPLDTVLSQRLQEIPFSNITQAFFAVKREDVKHPLDGPGFAVLPGEGLHTRICVFETRFSPGHAPEGEVLLRVMAGGNGRPPLPSNPEQLLSTLYKELCGLLQITAPPRFQHLQTLERAFPQYEVGHVKRLRALDERLILHPGLFLAGNSYRAIGISRILSDAQHTVDRMMELLRGREQL